MIESNSSFNNVESLFVHAISLDLTFNFKSICYLIVKDDT